MTAILQEPGTGGSGLPAAFTPGQTDPTVIIDDADGNPVLSALPVAGIVHVYTGAPTGANAQVDVSFAENDDAGLRRAAMNPYVQSDDGMKYVSATYQVSINPVDGSQGRGSLTLAGYGVTGFVGYEFDQDAPFARFVGRASPGQTVPLLDLRKQSGDPGFQVAADGAPILFAPNGSGWRLVVANDGTLSTVAA